MVQHPTKGKSSRPDFGFSLRSTNRCCLDTGADADVSHLASSWHVRSPRDLLSSQGPRHVSHRRGVAGCSAGLICGASLGAASAGTRIPARRARHRGCGEQRRPPPAVQQRRAPAPANKARRGAGWTAPQGGADRHAYAAHAKQRGCGLAGAGAGAGTKPRGPCALFSTTTTSSSSAVLQRRVRRRRRDAEVRDYVTGRR